MEPSAFFIGCGKPNENFKPIDLLARKFFTFSTKWKRSSKSCDHVIFFSCHGIVKANFSQGSQTIQQANVKKKKKIDRLTFLIFVCLLSISFGHYNFKGDSCYIPSYDRFINEVV